MALSARRVLVLGGTGMLGSMVCRVLARNPALAVARTTRGSAAAPGPAGLSAEFPLDAELPGDSGLATALERFRPEYVVNCIGVINVHCRDGDPAGVLKAVRVNAVFPHVLAAALRARGSPPRVLHITTDCVFSGNAGAYDESAVHDPVDFYGKSKSLGEVQTGAWLNLRASIVGPEERGRWSLLEWFLAQPSRTRLTGYANHLWNGVTTLQFARLCEEIVTRDSFDAYRGLNHTLHYVVNEAVSKYELLCLLRDVYGRDCEIERGDAPGAKVDRTLASMYLRWPLRPMRSAIEELRREGGRP